MTSPPIRLLIAEDHAIVREGLVAMLNRTGEFHVVAEAANGEEAIALFRKHRPDVVLVDLRMPVLDGLGALTAIREEHPAARVIILTTFDGDEGIYRGLRAGAKAYLLKDATLAALAQCIRDVHAGQTVLEPALAAKLATRVGTPELTARELEVLELMAKGLSNKEIGVQLSVSETTVKTHATAILHKLSAVGRTEAVTLALKRGLVTM